jgi:hypothetical protein
LHYDSSVIDSQDYRGLHTPVASIIQLTAWEHSLIDKLRQISVGVEHLKGVWEIEQILEGHYSAEKVEQSISLTH